MTLFDRRGADGNDLRDTRFDDDATRTIDLAVAPFVGTFRPNGGLLADLVGDDALGTWTLRVTDLWSGEAGRVNSWGLTVTTDPVRSGVALNSLTPVNELGNSVASRIRSLELEFSAPMNPATVTPADVKVIGPTGLQVRILSLVPAAGTNNTRFLVTTPLWAKAGVYTVKLNPAVADIYGNGLDMNGNGVFLEAADAVTSTHTVANHVFVSKGPPGRDHDRLGPRSCRSPSATSRRGQIMVEINIAHPNLSDLHVVMFSPGTTVTCCGLPRRPGQISSARSFRNRRPTHWRTDLPLTVATSSPQNHSMVKQSPKMGTWKLFVEDKGSGALASLLSWSLYIKP